MQILAVFAASNEQQMIPFSGWGRKARSAMLQRWREPQTRSTATALAAAQRGKQNSGGTNKLLFISETH
jgi:hypothetical protein